MKKLFLLVLLLSPLAYAKTLKSILLLPPADGYHLSTGTSTAQITPQCTYTDLTTDNCASVALTWGVTDTQNLSVTSSGLAAIGTGFGGGITSIVRSGNVVTLTTASGTGIDYYGQNVPLVVSGVTDSSFDGTFYITGTPTGNSVTFAQTGSNASSSGGKVQHAGLSVDVYAYSGAILGHHQVYIDDHVMTGVVIRPESGASTIVLGTTVTVGAMDTTYSTVQGTYLGDICTWTSSDPTKASVNSIGEITAVAVGSSTITCTYQGLTATRTVTVTSPTITNNTYYVRSDGGTRYDAAVPSGQCNGLTNAAYPGSGTNQACAFNTPMYCYTDETSGTVYTGAVQSGDTCLIAPSTAVGGYNVGGKNSTTSWIGPTGGSISIPSGTPSNHTKYLGTNYASCSTDQDHTGNRTLLNAYYDGVVFDFRGGNQNVDVGCLDISNFADCNHGLSGYIDFDCPNSSNSYGFAGDTFSSNINLTGDRMRGFVAGFVGTAGLNVVMTNTSVQGNFLAGLDFDDPFGYDGNRMDGFVGEGMSSSYSGCTQEVPKALTSVSRDGTGNLTATFAAGQLVNYLSGTNLVLTGMTPSDLNGTFPVTAINFNQQTVNITGGTCTKPGPVPVVCTITTDVPPAFVQGAFVKISSATTAFLNGNYEVYSTSSTGFVVAASPMIHPGWVVGTLASGGTVSTAISVTASASGSAESASTVGTASHVHPYHRCYDQNVGGGSNGDGVGTGGDTIGAWKCDKCTFKDNFQDGWDMLHSAMTTSTFTNSFSSGNMGAAAKFGNADNGLFAANIMIANCAVNMAFDPNKPPDFNQVLGMPCRANDAFPVGTRMWSNYVVTNNTFDSGHTIIMDSICTDPAGCDQLPTVSSFIFQNNVLLGYKDQNNPFFAGGSGGYPDGYYAQGTTPWVFTNNMGYNIIGSPSGTGNQWAKNPLVTTMIPDITTLSGESVALNFNMVLQAGSPAIGAGVHNANVPATDNVAYPFANPPSMGALEFATNPSTSAFFSGSSAISGSGSIN